MQDKPDNHCWSYFPENIPKWDFLERLSCLTIMAQYSHNYSEPSIFLVSKISVVFRVCVQPKNHKAMKLSHCCGFRFCFYSFWALKHYCFSNSVEVKQVLFGPGLFSFFQFMCTNFLVKITTYSILKTKEHKLHLADTMAVKVQLQLQFWKRGCDELAISGPYKLSEAGNECCDMFPF